jgi:hypothetical protein
MRSDKPNTCNFGQFGKRIWLPEPSFLTSIGTGMAKSDRVYAPAPYDRENHGIVRRLP